MPVMTCTGCVGLDHRAAQVRGVGRTAHELGHVARVQRERQRAARGRRGDSSAGDDRPVLETFRLTVVLSSVAVMAMYGPDGDDAAPSPVAHDAVVAGHRRARQEQRGVVRERVAADGLAERLHTVLPGHVLQSLPAGPPWPLYSRALNW